MAHENSITLIIDGKWRNIPSKVKGKQLTRKQAKDAAVDSGNIGRGFKTMPLALLEAKKRSRTFKQPPLVKKKTTRKRSK